MEFEVGTRVRLKDTTVGTWKDNKINTIARTGRLGTIIAVWGTAIPAHRRSYFVQFDVARKNSPAVREQINVNDLERVAE